MKNHWTAAIFAACDTALAGLPSPLQGQIQAALAAATPQEALYLAYLYSAMPQSDMADYPLAVYLGFARHALTLRQNSPWQVPDELFYNYVLHHRVNNEAIEDCRALFYRHLAPRIIGKTMEQAAIEINYWCLERATYRTTDERTVSPLTMLQSAYGRCGEESTFTVTALRSAGLPARQVYAPRWSHCDDNHAWVEVWCDGVWRYLGACEPEPVLDRGWFTAAASRAMLIHSRLFSSLTSEEVFGYEGKALLINRTMRYAKTRRFTVHCHMPSVTLRLSVLNDAQLIPIATLLTGEDGSASAVLGLGSIHIHAQNNGAFCEALVHTGEQSEITLCLSMPRLPLELAFIAPSASAGEQPKIPPEMLLAHRARFSACAALREERVRTFPAAPALLAKARGNAREVSAFLTHGPLAKKLLESLPEKDLTDCRAAALLDHLTAAAPFESRFPADIFIPYLLCPRVELEQITLWRSALYCRLTPLERERFAGDPRKIWEFVSDMPYRQEQEYMALITSPAGLLTLKSGSENSKKVLFVALCRTLGIPARLRPEDKTPQYYQNGRFVSALAQPAADSGAPLKLLGQSGVLWSYFQNFSLARLSGGVFKTLDLSGRLWENGALLLVLPEGEYRLITTNRALTGNSLVRQYRFSLPETTELALSQRTLELSDMLFENKLPEFTLYDEAGAAQASEALLREARLLFWLQAGGEPSEHILNEIAERCARFSRLPCRITFLLQEPAERQNPTIAKVLAALPGIQTLYDPGTQAAEPVARRMYLDPDKLPLIVLTDKKGNGIYGCSGYNVGTGDLLLRIIQKGNAQLF